MKIISKGIFKSIKQFKILERKLGSGSFGVVKLAVHKSTGKQYAIKIIDLANVPSQAELKLIEREIRIHSQLKHPHCIALWDTISQDQCIYMILQYAEKGNLFFHQNVKQIFNEPQAALFFGQTVKAIQYLHSADIMHRDIKVKQLDTKPQNLLLDHAHNVKLCDYGWCAESIRQQRSTFCGTYEYMAPQMLFHSSYDYRIDIWALGVLLYQLTHGYAPFRGDSVNEVKQNMLKGSYQLSDTFSQSLKDLMTKILKFDPNQRYSVKQILNHSWLKQMQLIGEECLQKMQDNCADLYTLIANHENKPIKNQKSTKKERNPTRNISFNLSINNFAYIKQTQRSNFNSPNNPPEKRKKKQQKRLRTQAEEQLLDIAQSLSPPSKKAPNTRREKQRKDRKAVLRQKSRKSQSITDKSPFRAIEHSVLSRQTPSKLNSIVKKKSLHQKFNSVVSSMKSLHKVKTGSKGNTSNLSGLNY